MKRKLALMCAVLVGVSTILGTTGCGSSGKDGDNSKAASGKAGDETASGSEEKAKIVFLRTGTDNEKKVYWQEMIEGFEKVYPGIEVEYQESPAGDDFETKLNTGFASGTAPDVINFTMASMGTRIPLGQYAPLDEYMEGWDGKEDFLESTMVSGQMGGKQYGIPVLPDPRIIIYNKEMFEEAGLDPNSPPTTWDELLEAHKKLVKKDGDTVVQTGFGLPTSGSTMQHFFSAFIEQNGVKNLVDEETNEILCNAPEAVEAAEFMKQIKDEGIISWDSSNADQNPFQTGLAAITMGADTDFKKWSDSGLEGKIAMAPPLKETKQAAFCGVSFMFMSSETAHPEESWKFIEYISRPENMWKRYEEFGATPVRESLRDRFIEANPEVNPVIFETVACGTGSPKVPYANSVYNIINQAMEEIMYDVSMPQKALDDAAAKIQEEIDNQ